MQNLLETQSSYMDTINIDDLADIQDVKIDASLPKEERIKSYLRQIKNPYCYKCNDMVVRVSFANTDATLEDRIKQYLFSGQCTSL